jgi:hypothetical protein
VEAREDIDEEDDEWVLRDGKHLRPMAWAEINILHNILFLSHSELVVAPMLRAMHSRL